VSVTVPVTVTVTKLGTRTIETLGRVVERRLARGSGRGRSRRWNGLALELVDRRPLAAGAIALASGIALAALWQHRARSTPRLGRSEREPGTPMPL
jgi:hypothetical protein